MVGRQAHHRCLYSMERDYKSPLNLGRVGGVGGVFRPHTEGTEAQSFLEHRGELALARRTQSNEE